MRIRTTTHIGTAFAIFAILVIGLFDTTAVEAASITAPTDYVIPQGPVGSVPILLNEARDVVSGMLQLDYDPTQYRVSGVTTADATEDYLVASRIEAGSVYIALAGAQATHSGEGAILNIELEATGAAAGPATFTVAQASFNGGWIEAIAIEPTSANAPLDYNLAPKFPNHFNPAFDWTPAWSPDGSLLAFASDRIGDFEIYTMNADGTNLTQLTDSPANDRSPSWSADGTGPVNLSNDAGIDWAPMWSPVP